MPVMDEFKAQRESIKNKPLSARISYFWTYYKWHVIISLAVIGTILSLVVEISSEKEKALYCAVVNGYSLDQDSSLANAFAEHLQLDTNKYTITINHNFTLGADANSASLVSVQYLNTYLEEGELDALVMDPDHFLDYAYSGYFQSLPHCLDAETLEKLSGNLIYIDVSVAESITKRLESGEFLTAAEYPYSKDPSTLAQPVAFGIDISNMTKFTDAYRYEGGICYYGIVANAEYLSNAVEFVSFLLEE